MRVSDTQTILTLVESAWMAAWSIESQAVTDANIVIVKRIASDARVIGAWEGNRDVLGVPLSYNYGSGPEAPSHLERHISYRLDNYRENDEPKVLIHQLAQEYGWNPITRMFAPSVSTPEYKDLDVCLRASKMKPNEFLALRNSIRESLSIATTREEILIVIKKYVEMLTKGNENVSGTSW